MDTPKLLKALVQTTLIQQNWISKENLEALIKNSPKKPLAELLITKGVISRADFQKIITEAKNQVGQMRARTAKTPDELATLMYENRDQKIAEQPTVDGAIPQNLETDSLAKTVVIPGIHHPTPAKTVPMLPTKKRFGKYEVIEKLAQGAMGIVYKVKHLDLGQICALKVIISGEHASEEAIRRFYQEAKTAAKIKHPNIIQVLDMGQEGLEHFFVMEYVEGKTLEQCIEDGLSVKDGVRLLQKSLEALHTAHQQGVIHRDLKPSNIFITTKKEPKIGDFGLAKDLSRDSRSQQLTQSGVILGTPAYMPPEQAMGETAKLDARTDIYAMGVCLYQILTARLPFEGNTLHELFYKLVNDEVTPPSKWNSSVSKDLDTITLKALEKIRTKRYQSAKMFASDLDCFLRGYPIRARSVSSWERVLKWAKRNRMVVSSAGIILLSLGSFYGYTSFNAYQIRQQQLQTLDQEARQFQNDAEEFLKQQKKADRFSFLLQSLNKLNLLLSLAPKYPEARLQKFKVGKQLIEIACSNQEYEFASYLAQDMREISEALKKEDLMQQVQIQKNKQSQEHLEQFEMWIEKLQLHTVESIDREDAIYEISQMSEPEIFQRLLKYLKEGTNYFLKNSNRELHLKNFYITIVKILERLGNRDATSSLIDAFVQIKKQYLQEENAFTELDFAVHIAGALGRFQAAEALNPLEELSQILGANHAISKSLQKARKKILQMEKEEIRDTEIDAFQKGKNAFLLGHLDESFIIFEEILKQKPNFAEAYFYRGRIYQMKQAWKEALKDYNSAIKITPESPVLYNQRGQVQEMLKKDKEATDDFTMALFLDPKYTEAYINFGIFRSRRENFEVALLNYDQAIQINPMIPDAYYNRGSVKRRMKQYGEAIRDFNETIRLNAQFAEAYTGRAQIFVIYQEYNKALKDYNIAIQLKPEYPNTYFHRGFLKEQLEDYQGALEDFLKAIQLNPEYALAYAHCYISLEKLGRFPEAEQAYQKAIQLDPSLADKIRKKK